MLEAVFANILEISIVTGVIILIIAKAFPKLQKRYTVQFRKVLWMIIAVRLLVPYNYTLPNTPIRLFDTSKVIVHDGFSVSIEEGKDGKKADTDAKKNVNENADKPDSGTENEHDRTDEKVDIAQDSKLDSGALKLPLLVWAAVIWAVGMIISVRKDYIHYNYFLQHCEESTEIEEGVLYEIFRGVCSELGMKEIPQLFRVPEVETPMILGMRTPFMVIPERNFSENEWRMAFMHECMHYKKHDLLYKRIIAFAASMYWFHPAVRYMRKMAFRDVELVCDRAVVEAMSREEKRTYGNMLLKVAAHSGKEVDWSTAFFGSKEIVKERLRNVFDSEKKKRGIVPAGVVLALMVTGSLVFACGNPPAKKEENKITAEKQGVRLTLLDAAGSDYGFYIKMQVDIPRAYILKESAKFETVIVDSEVMKYVSTAKIVPENECRGILYISCREENYRNWGGESVSLKLDELVLERGKSIDVELDMTVDFAKFQTQGEHENSQKTDAKAELPDWFRKQLEEDEKRDSESWSLNDLRCYIHSGSLEERLWFNGNDVDSFDWEKQEITFKASSGIEKIAEGTVVELYLGENLIFQKEFAEDGAGLEFRNDENRGNSILILPTDYLKAENGFFYEYLSEKGLLKE